VSATASSALQGPARLVVVGSAIVDVVLDVPELPQPGGDVIATAVAREPGGAFNVASAAARLGLPTVYAGPHGTGPHGDLLRAALAVEDVAVASLPASDDTGYCITLVEASGERTFITVGGADMRMSAEHLATVTFATGDAAYVTGYDLGYDVSGPALAKAVPSWPTEVTVVVDPGPLVAEIPWSHWQRVAPHIDVLSWSAREAVLLPQLRSLLRRDAVVVRRTGRDGAVLELPDQAPLTVPGVPVEPVDTNGAGDVHVGAMLAARHAGLGWHEAVAEANAAAALSTLVRGGAGGPTRTELLAWQART